MEDGRWEMYHTADAESVPGAEARVVHPHTHQSVVYGAKGMAQPLLVAVAVPDPSICVQHGSRLVAQTHGLGLLTGQWLRSPPYTWYFGKIDGHLICRSSVEWNMSLKMCVHDLRNGP